MTESITAKHITAIIAFLNQSADYAVLRNYEGLPNANNSRDIDIIISKSSFKAVRKALVDIIVDNGWKIVTYLYSDRLVTFVCGFQTESTTELVQWDFFMDTSVYGVVLMNAEEYLVNRQFNGFLYHVDGDTEFLDKYLYNRAVGSKYPEKYKAVRQRVEDSEVVRKKLSQIYGVKSLAECDKASSRNLLQTALWNNLKRNALGTVMHIILFLYTFARNYVCSDTGFSIGFTGPDGSGKTTVIDLLIENLGDVFRKAHEYYHFRPGLFKNIGDVAQSAGLKKNVDREYSKPHRGEKTGVLSSFARLLFYSTDYILGYFKKVKTKTRITRLVVFDRYYTDIICDSRRSSIYLNPKFLYWFGKCFIPSLDYNILLTAETETILKRKKELDREGIETINSKIDYLKDKKGYLKVMNENAPQEAVMRILKHVFDTQHKRNLKRLNVII